MHIWQAFIICCTFLSCLRFDVCMNLKKRRLDLNYPKNSCKNDFKNRFDYFRRIILFKYFRKMVSGTPESTNQKWISVSDTPFCTNHFVLWWKELLKAQIILNIAFRSSFLFKTNWKMVSGVPFCAKQIKYRFRELLFVQNSLNIAFRSSWKRKS